MPEFSKLEWLIPRHFPDQTFEKDIYCLGKGRYILKKKGLIKTHYYLLYGYGENEHEEFVPKDHPEIDLKNIKAYQLEEQISRKDTMIEKTMEYLETVPEYTLLELNNIDEPVFGVCKFIEPSTLQYPAFDLEYSMFSIYLRELVDTANERGIFFVDLDQDLLKCLDGYDKDKRQCVLRKNCLRKEIKTEERAELSKETFSGHSVRILYSLSEKRVKDVLLLENPEPKRKTVSGLDPSKYDGPHDYEEYQFEEEIFKAAYGNDLAALKECIAKGQDIRVHDGNYGYSILTAWLAGYYRQKDMDIEEMIYRTLNSHRNGDFPPDILCIPLDHRKDGLLEAIEWMLENGLELNDGYSDDREIDNTPLSLAVSNMDYYLTEYLLEHGEDPYEWFYTDPEERPEKESEDWLGRIIAGHLDNSEEFVYTATWLKFAKLLRRYGYTGVFDGWDYFSLILHEEDDSVEWKQTMFNLY